MAITDLTGYTWVGNDVLNLPSETSARHIDFSCGADLKRYVMLGTTYSGFIYGYMDGGRLRTILVYSPSPNPTWTPKYKTIEITGGADATNPDLIAWLEANGTLTKSGGGSTLNVTYNSQKIIDSLEVTPPVTVTYNGSTIATLNAGDTETLQCNGKVMASNIGIGDKTLQCNGKLMASDVTIEVGG